MYGDTLVALLYDVLVTHSIWAATLTLSDEKHLLSITPFTNQQLEFTVVPKLETRMSCIVRRAARSPHNSRASNNLAHFLIS